MGEITCASCARWKATPDRGLCEERASTDYMRIVASSHGCAEHSHVPNTRGLTAPRGGASDTMNWIAFGLCTGIGLFLAATALRFAGGGCG